MWPFYLNKLKSSLPRNALAKFGWNCYFVIISSKKKAWPFIEINLYTLHPRVRVRVRVCGKLVWNWPSGSEKVDFFKFVNVFLKFCNYLHLEKGGTLQPRMICAKFGWNLPTGSADDDFWILWMYFLYNYLTFEKGGALHLKNLHTLH